jgi:hypothetical protein
MKIWPTFWIPKATTLPIRQSVEPFELLSVGRIFWPWLILPQGYREFRHRRDHHHATTWGERLHFRVAFWWINTFKSLAEREALRGRRQALDLDWWPRVKPGEDALGRYIMPHMPSDKIMAMWREEDRIRQAVAQMAMVPPAMLVMGHAMGQAAGAVVGFGEAVRELAPGEMVMVDDIKNVQVVTPGEYVSKFLGSIGDAAMENYLNGEGPQITKVSGMPRLEEV